MQLNINTKNRDIQCFLLDMDGTIYLGDKLLPGAKDFINLLNQKNFQYLFLTNNSSKSAKEYQQKLNHLGLNESQNKILTSGEATCIYLQNIRPGARIHVCGTLALVKEFQKNGFILDDDHPEFVVLGYDTTITYTKLDMFSRFVRLGVPYIATHADINCPIENGGFLPDVGSLIAFVFASTGRQPDVIIGKPNQPMIDAVLKKTLLGIHEIAMIGDRLYTDVAMGSAGIITILVLSGETNLADAHASRFKANLIVKDLSELIKIIFPR